MPGIEQENAGTAAEVHCQSTHVQMPSPHRGKVDGEGEVVDPLHLYFLGALEEHGQSKMSDSPSLENNESTGDTDTFDPSFPPDEDVAPEVVVGEAIEGDLTPMPPEVKQGMFCEPPGFDSNCLKKLVQTEGHPRFHRDAWAEMTPEQKSSLHLLRILKGKDIALFDKIQKWRWSCEFEYRDTLSRRDQPISREKATENLREFYGHKGMMPRVSNVTLPETNKNVDIVVFSFADMFASLLTDPELMQPENLSFDPGDSSAVPQVGGIDGFLGDINTGEVHCAAHKRLCKTEKDMLAEIVLFVDKTHLDVKGRHTLEPIMFTTCLFNARCRARDDAWRPLGYIPNFSKICANAPTDVIQRDYHHCIRIIMSDLVAHQRLNGLNWTFRFDAIQLEKRLHIPVNLWMGDTDGADKSHGPQSKQSREG